MRKSIGEQSVESVESVLKKKKTATVGRICGKTRRTHLAVRLPVVTHCL